MLIATLIIIRKYYNVIKLIIYHMPLITANYITDKKNSMNAHIEKDI